MIHTWVVCIEARACTLPCWRHVERERERAVESGEERAEHERLQLNHVLDWAFG